MKHKRKVQHNLDYATRLQLKKAKELSDASTEAFTFAGNLIAVALNEKFGFGAKRLKILEEEATRILNEEFGGDPEVAAYGMKRRIEQIRGKGWDVDG